MTKNELLASSKRERALGNDLVAACLHDAAYGNFPTKKEKRIHAIFDIVSLWGLTAPLLGASLILFLRFMGVK